MDHFFMERKGVGMFLSERVHASPHGSGLRIGITRRHQQLRLIGFQ
jgi:hypothetical protein